MPDPPAEPVLHCPTCGYNLTGLPENRCPECSRTLSHAELIRLANRPCPLTQKAWLFYLLAAPGALWCAVLFIGLLK